jgi:lipid-binding SYLF domain-containing protein
LLTEDGFYKEEKLPPSEVGPNKSAKQRVLMKIPANVVKNAVGMAIFTTMRSGLWVSGAGGSGILVARLEDGSWSPPSGIMLHTAGIGFLVGIDIYDCVVIINSRKTLESFTKIRATVGGEISAVAGPVGVGGVIESDGKWKQVNRPVFTYLKSRGFYAGVQLDGTVIIERTDENERFYGERISAANILAGKVRFVPRETKMLLETLKLAEGRSDYDQGLMEELEDQPAPGDVDVESTTVFGIPEPDDPDPFGVLALEEAGLEIKEAGSHSRPSSSQFEYKPSPTSPIFPHLNRMSMDTGAGSRASYMSNSKRTSLRTARSISMGTQTDADDSSSVHAKTPIEAAHTPVEKVGLEPPDVDYTQIDLGPYSGFTSPNHASEFNGSGTTITEQESPESQHHEGAEKHAEPKHQETSVKHVEPQHQERSEKRTEPEYRERSEKRTEPQNHEGSDKHGDSEVDNSSDDGLDDDEPVVFEAAAATRRPTHINVVKARGNVVTIPPRPTPPLPPRSSARGSRSLVNGVWENGSPLASPRSDRFSPLSSPRADGFEIAKLNGSPSSRPSSLQSQTEKPNGATENGVKAVDEANGVKEKKSSDVDEANGVKEKKSSEAEVPYGQYLSSGNQTSKESPKEETIPASAEKKDSPPESAAEVPLPSSNLPEDGDESQNEDFQDAVDAPADGKEDAIDAPTGGKDTSTDTKI